MLVRDAAPGVWLSLAPGAGAWGGRGSDPERFPVVARVWQSCPRNGERTLRAANGTEMRRVEN